VRLLSDVYVDSAGASSRVDKPVGPSRSTMLGISTGGGGGAGCAPGSGGSIS